MLALLSSLALAQTADAVRIPDGRPFLDHWRTVVAVAEDAARGDAAARSALEDRAIAGDRVAQLHLGSVLRRQDPGSFRAVDLWRSASRRGLRAARHQLALVLLHGDDVLRDTEQGLHLLREAAHAGSVPAALELARLYDEGEVVEPDPGAALRWFELAADGGDYDAGLEVARRLADGRGTEVDFFASAVAHLRAELQYRDADADERPEGPPPLARLRERAEAGDANALVVLGFALADAVDPRIADVDAGTSFLTRAAEDGVPAAASALGNLYSDEQYGRRDDALAARWFRRAADAGDAYAQTQLGLLHLQGLGRPVDEDAAVQWFERAAAQGDPDALHLLATILQNDDDPANDARALALLRPGLEAREPSALTGTGVAYLDGVGVEMDLQRAAELLTEAAEAGEIEAQYLLGTVERLLYPHGPLGAVTAKRWLGEAALAGIDEAFELLELQVERGDREAALALARTFFATDSARRDDARALALAETLAADRYEAQVLLARILHDGDARVRDRARAVAVMRANIDYHDDDPCAEARYDLAVALFEDVGTPHHDPEAAIEVIAELLHRDSTYAPALDWLAERANSGDVRAHYLLATSLLENAQSPERRARGLEGMRRLADAGHAAAWRGLAELHVAGDLVDTDLARGVELYRRALALGDDEALAALADLCVERPGEIADGELELEWLERWAESTEEGAQWIWAEVARRYGAAEGVPRDEERMRAAYYRSLDAGGTFEAFEWAEGAAEAGDVEAAFRLALAHDNEWAVVPRYYVLPAEAGNAEARMRLGFLIARGYHVGELTEGLDWLRQAADQGHSGAVRELGRLGFDALEGAFDDTDADAIFGSLGGARDPATVAGWLARAARAGDPFAMVDLAACYRHGYGVAEDALEAAAWSWLGLRRGAGETSLYTQEFVLGGAPSEAELLAPYPSDSDERARLERRIAELAGALPGD